ncbi:hypothetical protein VCHA35O135_100135 [Vibrio chagasii]|nr:hypothetical protein VCHA35O135_100135 [Vibrio chagasii]
MARLSVNQFVNAKALELTIATIKINFPLNPKDSLESLKLIIPINLYLLFPPKRDGHSFYCRWYGQRNSPIPPIVTTIKSINIVCLIG